MKEIVKKYRLSEMQLSKLKKLVDIALEYNAHTNITAIKNRKEFWEKHILDSLELLKMTNIRDKSLLDVGTGGGFPGLALAIASPSTEFTLLDSNGKKTTFIKHAKEELDLRNVEVITDRVESLKDDLWEKFDVVTSRAVAPLNLLVEITSFAVDLGGALILFKGANYEEETPLSWDEVNILGIEYSRTYYYQLSDKIDRYILKFDKIKQTNEQYPREWSKILKQPIY